MKSNNTRTISERKEKAEEFILARGSTIGEMELCVSKMGLVVSGMVSSIKR
jgi:hypothetical protein